jgi:hypothetical protein
MHMYIYKYIYLHTCTHIYLYITFYTNIHLYIQIKKASTQVYADLIIHTYDHIHTLSQPNITFLFPTGNLNGVPLVTIIIYANILV